MSNFSLFRKNYLKDNHLQIENNQNQQVNKGLERRIRTFEERRESLHKLNERLSQQMNESFSEPNEMDQSETEILYDDEEIRKLNDIEILESNFCLPNIHQNDNCQNFNMLEDEDVFISIPHFEEDQNEFDMYIFSSLESPITLYVKKKYRTPNEDLFFILNDETKEFKDRIEELLELLEFENDHEKLFIPMWNGSRWIINILCKNYNHRGNDIQNILLCIGSKSLKKEYVNIIQNALKEKFNIKTKKYHHLKIS